MKRYWDASALIDAIHDSRVEAKAQEPGQVTRVHTLAEVFSTLTGGRLGFQYLADDAAELIDEITSGFEFVELNADEVRDALAGAQKAGVRGGRVHDWLHAVAAKKAKVKELLTDNVVDFTGLQDGYKIVAP
jgi:hypothetical protein